MVAAPAGAKKEKEAFKESHGRETDLGRWPVRSYWERRRKKEMGGASIS